MDTQDNEDIQVDCSIDTGGYAITLTDPGRPMTDPNDPNNKARGRSVLTITKGAVKGNKCIVQLEDTTTGGTHYLVKDACTGVSDLPYDGSCTLTGNANSNGYDFDGTIQCTGMRVNGMGPADYRVGQARALASPVKLQIKHCSK